MRPLLDVVWLSEIQATALQYAAPSFKRRVALLDKARDLQRTSPALNQFSHKWTDVKLMYSSVHGIGDVRFLQMFIVKKQKNK